jgi:Rieske Fe-S protein
MERRGVLTTLGLAATAGCLRMDGEAGPDGSDSAGSGDGSGGTTTAPDPQGQALVLEGEHTADGETWPAGTPIEASMLGEPPATVLAYPENLQGEDDFLIRLHRLEPDRIADPTDPDLVADGFVAYSAICTHAGCTVGWEHSDDEPANVDEAAREGASDFCPCHMSSFDPYVGATVLGGPAARPLPQIGVRVTDAGMIELTTGFEDTVGVG